MTGWASQNSTEHLLFKTNLTLVLFKVNVLHFKQKLKLFCEKNKSVIIINNSILISVISLGLHHYIYMNL